MTFIFPHIGNVIIPIDVHIFQRGRYTTNQIGALEVILKDLEQKLGDWLVGLYGSIEFRAF